MAGPRSVARPDWLLAVGEPGRSRWQALPTVVAGRAEPGSPGLAGCTLMVVRGVGDVDCQKLRSVLDRHGRRQDVATRLATAGVRVTATQLGDWATGRYGGPSPKKLHAVLTCLGHDLSEVLRDGTPVTLRVLRWIAGLDVIDVVRGTQISERRYTRLERGSRAASELDVQELADLFSSRGRTVTNAQVREALEVTKVRGDPPAPAGGSWSSGGRGRRSRRLGRDRHPTPEARRDAARRDRAAVDRQGRRPRPAAGRGRSRTSDGDRVVTDSQAMRELMLRCPDLDPQMVAWVLGDTVPVFSARGGERLPDAAVVALLAWWSGGRDDDVVARVHAQLQQLATLRDAADCTDVAQAPSAAEPPRR